MVTEPGTATAVTLWARADRVVSVRLVYPEARAALAQAQRVGRLTARRLRTAVACWWGLLSLSPDYS